MRPSPPSASIADAVSDDTARRALLEEDSRRFLETLLGNLPGIVYRCANTPAWPFTFVNKGVRDITGWAPDDFISRRVEFGNLIVEEHRQSVWEGVQGAIAERRPYYLTYRIRSRDGREHWLWEKGCGVFDAAGQLECLEGFILDISQEKGLEQLLLQAHKMEAVGRLAGGVAHDFNNLLTAILGYADMLAAALAPDSQQHGQAQQVLRAAQRAADLTRKLLAFARKQLIEPRVFDPGELILAIDPLLRRLIGEDIELVTLPGRAVGSVDADPGQIEQVLVNLAVNARAAMPEGGKLTIETLEVELDEAAARDKPDVVPGRYVVLAVSDTGVGMDRETLAHIFEPFFTTKRAGEGTGLGLATCYGIVKQAGGHITVHSQPGCGTEFKVYLPRASKERVSLPARRLPEGTRGGSETILLVEDEPLVRQVAEEALKGLGYTVLSARSGIEALELTGRYSQAIHLLLTDLVMPQMSGREVARRVRALRPEMRVLYVSGYGGDPALHPAETDAGIAFLPKPFTRRTLGASVRALLDGR